MKPNKQTFEIRNISEWVQAFFVQVRIYNKKTHLQEGQCFDEVQGYRQKGGKLVGDKAVFCIVLS